VNGYTNPHGGARLPYIHSHGPLTEEHSINISIPVIAETDVLVVGCRSGGVEAAVAARKAGATVFMIAAESYPGADICAQARYWLEPGQQPATALAEELFASALQTSEPLIPMRVKYGLEQAMLQAGVRWLYLTHPVCLLRDDTGQLAGMVIANRSGFQAIRANAILDTTDRALAGSMTTAPFRPFPAGHYPAEFVTLHIDNRWQDIPTAAEPFPQKMRTNDQSFTGYCHRLTVAMPDASPQSWAKALYEARLQTWHPALLLASERLHMLPPDRLDSGHEIRDWHPGESLPLEAFQCRPDPVYVLGPRADLAPTAMHELLKPCNLMAVGQHLGKEIAASVSATPNQRALHPDYPADAIADLDICRQDRYFRFAEGEQIPFSLNHFPLLADVDVLVAGGGTGGAPAGIAAGRAGARTIILEMLTGLGGVGTEGRIATYYHGNRCGFTAEIDQGVGGLAPDPDFGIAKGNWNTEWKKHWYLKTNLEAGTQVWFGSSAVAAAMQDRHVRGALVATPYGLGLVRAGVLVDATGNADVAAAAGARTVNISKAHVAVQGTGLSPINLGHHYQNSDYTFVDDTDIMDVTRAFALARHKFRHCFDVAQIIDSRQRQQVEGEVSLDPLDFLAGRTFPDTVVTARSNFDSHGFTIHPVFMARPPDEESLDAHIPFRCLLPKGLEGILITGLGVSAHRDALPVIRMQPDVQNQGYAAGHAAALAARTNSDLRALDVRQLQRHLIDVGILQPDVVAHEDSFPLPAKKIEAAVAGNLENQLDLAMIFGHPDVARPHLQSAYTKAEGPRKLRIAHLLGLMGDATGAPALMAHLDATPWDEGWNFRGMGQYGFSLSPIDSMLVALGRTGVREAIPVLLHKAESMPADAAFSHYRAITLAFEALPTPDAAPHFERYLAAVRGAQRQSLEAQLRDVPESDVDTLERNRELKELLLARGLFACGDPQGIAREILKAYSQDLHGHYARHARAILGNAN